MRRLILSAAMTLACVLLASPALADKRAGLVIGNNAYQYGGALKNAVNDARAVAAALKRRGFDFGPDDAGIVLDADKRAMERALRDFRTRSQGADIAVVYYSGHGVQDGAVNLLAPVDARLDDLGDLDLETVRLESLLSQMRGVVNAVILDSCRNNPFADRLARAAGRQGRSYGESRGMARIDAKALTGGSLVALAAAPGEVALDGSGANSPYAAALTDLLNTPPKDNPQLDLRKLFAAVREEVERVTDNRQRPEAVDRLPSRDVYLLAAVQAPPPPVVRGPRVVDDLWSGVEAGKSYTLSVLNNDAAAQGGALRVASVGAVSRGRAEVARDGRSVTYTAPSDGTGGEVSFSYKVREDGGGEAEGRVTLALTAPPAPRSNVIPVVGVFPQVKSVFKDCADCPEMVVAPKGSFIMGSPDDEPRRESDEGPQRRVTIPRDFAVGRYEVTQGEWRSVMGSDPSNFKGDRLPVETVSWNEAQEFAKRLSAKTKQTYRLLTEAEWEYAARAGTTTPFSTGRTITTDQANFDGNYTYNGGAKGVYRRKMTPVGNFPANGFGLHDVHGNVWEWLEDCYAYNYRGAPNDGSAASGDNSCERVLRGGSWDLTPEFLRSANRVGYNPDSRASFIGFRLARTLP